MIAHTKGPAGREEDTNNRDMLGGCADHGTGASPKETGPEQCDFHTPGPAGLALIAGSSNYVKPGVTMSALLPGFAHFAAWYVLGAIAFAFIAMETRGRTIDEIDAELSAPTASPRTAKAPA